MCSIVQPLFCVGVNAFHGVDDCHLKPGQLAAIVGCGSLGHMVSLVPRSTQHTFDADK